MPKASSSASARPSKGTRIAASKKSSRPAAPSTSSSSSSKPTALSKKAAAKAASHSGGLEPPQGKQLASTEKVVRDAAIKQLAAFLSGQDDDGSGAGGSLDEAEMRKLWKGLFYCALLLPSPPWPTPTLQLH